MIHSQPCFFSSGVVPDWLDENAQGRRDELAHRILFGHRSHQPANDISHNLPHPFRWRDQDYADVPRDHRGFGRVCFSVLSHLRRLSRIGCARRLCRASLP